ncbi:MAG: hypothetical protein KGJ75_18255, partial [Alphaproteobacteria bacterium]|nr:hypothetical protein [Alphaproteobacteria bacterium]
MLIWRGWGIAVFFLWLLWLAGAGIIVASGIPYFDGLSGDLSMQWVVGLACIFDAGTVLLLSRYRASHPKRVSDAASGQTFLVARVDDLFYVPMRWWTWILLVLGVVQLG